MNRIDRLSAILILLQSSLSVKPKQITERFGIGIRTVYRDIRALEEVGIPITGDSRTGYSLVEGYKLPPLMFTQEEAFAFLAAEKLVDKFTDSGLQEGYKSGINKIRAVMRFAEKETMASVDSRVGHLDFHTTGLPDSQNKLQLILDSVSKQYKIDINYFSYTRHEYTRRIVDPVGVFFSMANWYLIGFCNNSNDYRTFKINRIQQISSTDISVGRKHPSLDIFLQKLKEQANLRQVIIDVDVDYLSIIGESKYYQGLVSEEKIGNKVRLFFMTFSMERFSRWYLSYMDIATIISPKELQQITADIIQGSKVR